MNSKRWTAGIYKTAGMCGQWLIAHKTMFPQRRHATGATHGPMSTPAIVYHPTIHGITTEFGVNALVFFILALHSGCFKFEDCVLAR